MFLSKSSNPASLRREINEFTVGALYINTSVRDLVTYPKWGFYPHGTFTQLGALVQWRFGPSGGPWLRWSSHTENNSVVVILRLKEDPVRHTHRLCELVVIGIGPV